MFGVAEFLRDYSGDPKYRLVWQLAARRSEAHLNPGDARDVDPASANVEEFVKNIGELIRGEDLRGVLAERVRERAVFRVSAELSSRLFLGIVRALNEQVTAFSERACKSHLEPRSLAFENFEVIGRKKKAALIGSHAKSSADSKSDEIKKIEEILSDDELAEEESHNEEVNESFFSDKEGASQETVSEALKRNMEPTATPLQAANKKAFDLRQLMNLDTIPEGQAVPNTPVTPRYIEPQAGQEDDGQDKVVEMMLARMDGEIDGKTVKRTRRQNRNKKERSRELTQEPDSVGAFGPADVLPAIFSPHNNIEVDHNELPDMNSPFAGVPPITDGLNELAIDENTPPANGETVLEHVSVQRKKRTKKMKHPELPEYLASPIGHLINQSVDLFSEATPAKRKRRKKKRTHAISETEGNTTFVSRRSESLALEVAREGSIAVRSPLNNFDQIPDMNSPSIHLGNVPPSPFLALQDAPPVAEVLDAVPTDEHEKDFERIGDDGSSFAEVLSSCHNRRSAMEKFMVLMRLARTQVINIQQDSFMGEINIRRGPKFHTIQK